MANLYKKVISCKFVFYRHNIINSHYALFYIAHEQLHHNYNIIDAT